MKSLPLKTKSYLFMVYVTGIVITAIQLNRVDISQPVLLIMLCILSSLSLILRVEGATRNSHYSFSFLAYGFTFVVLGTPETIIVIIVSNIVEKIWNKQAWYIQLFNIGCYIISIQLAGVAYGLINPDFSQTSWQNVAAIITSAITFNVINHIMVGIVLWLARGENFKQSGIFEFFPFMLDLALLIFGASLSFVWYYNPLAIVLFAIPLYLIYSTLKVPALERKTEIDQKTGLFNHGYFMEQIKNELLRANRYDRPLAIIMADLDLLRNINNTYGHLAGDEVLKGVANILKRSVRDYDVVARFGGEEFAILLPETGAEQAIERAEIIRKETEAAGFSIPTSVEPIRATLSMGIATRESFQQTAEEIIHNADAALYNSKLRGRNRVFAYVHEEFRLTGQGVTPIETGNSESSQSNAGPATNYSAASRQFVATDKPEEEVVSQEPPVQKRQPEAAKEDTKPKSSHGKVYSYIGVLSLISLILISIQVFLTYQTPEASLTGNDWFGLLAISLIIITTEWFSIDLYVKNTSLSTTAVPLIASFYLFGSMGVILASLVFAITAAIKYRSPFNRIVFNLSNHILAGTAIILLTSSITRVFGSLNNNLLELICALAAALVMYLTTTSFISIGISIDLKQSPFEVWNQQYRWMAPYYIAIGFVAYALVFGYERTGILGLMVMMIPIFILRYSQVQYIEHTRDIVAELRKKNQELEKSSVEINELNNGLLLTLSEIIDLRDPYVLGHSKQVSIYSSEIARRLKLNERQIKLIRQAGLLHDIGKLGISAEILSKPGRLSREEYEIIKSHAALGGELVKNSPSLRPLIPIIRHHHEYYNGEGYPDKLSGNQISIEARIVSVADAIEAMISDRPYRKSLTFTQVMEELTRCSGTQFDPLVVKEAIKMLDSLKTIEDPIQNSNFGLSDLQLKFNS